MTVRELLVVSPLARKIVEGWGGLPNHIPPPQWSDVGEDDMAECQREVFVKYSNFPDEHSLSHLVRKFHCIAFMSDEEAMPWLPMWMLATVYALDVEGDYTENVIEWTIFMLTKALRSHRLPVSLEAVDHFANHVVAGYEGEDEFWTALAEYKASNGLNRNPLLGETELH